MQSTITLADILLRLAASVIAGAIIGFDRGTRGRIAGLRTTILICVAAAGAMIEGNLMLDVTGKTQSSFSMMDTLRFPLGILSGIGFIGAGVILKRGDMVMGVTTAATLWLVTVIGLVLGGGYFVLGGTMVVVAFVVLTLLVRLESVMDREHHAMITIDVGENGPATDMLRTTITTAGYKIKSLALIQSEDRHLRCSVAWSSRKASDQVPAVVDRLLEHDGVLRVDWQPIEIGPQHND